MIFRLRPTAMCLAAVFTISCGAHTQCANHAGPMTQVLIIKAAGLTEGQQPAGVDAITEATSEGRNVHVITKALQKTLKHLGIQSEIVRFNDTERLRETVQDSTVRLIVFAGPAYSSRFPPQLQNVVPKLQETILDHKMVCTSMTSCRFLDSGGWTVTSFNKGLKNLGIQTIDGLAVHHEYEDADWESKITAFAETVRQTLQNEK